MTGSRRKALVVDDSSAMRALVRAALEGVGLHAREAQDGAEAWRVLGEARYELIVTDIHMPVVDGLKLVGLVRSAGQHQRTPIVVITADGTREDCRRALDLGANLVLKKPIEERELAAAVTRLLER